MEINKRTWAEISLDNAKKNFLEIKNSVGNTPVCCVIKADGYGHGAVTLAELYENLGADFFAVSNLDEAIELREANITLPILILGFTDVSAVNKLAYYDVQQAVYSLDYADKLNEQCSKDNVKIKIHIKVDSGMSRIGFVCQEFPRDNNSLEEIYKVCNYDNFIVSGIFTHFCVSDEGQQGKEFTLKQFENFNHTVDYLQNKGVNLPIIHCSNSGAIEDYKETFTRENAMVRAGVILYGLAPSQQINNNLNLLPLMTIKSVVANVKYIEKGASISYGRTFIAQDKMKVATIPIGYADGYIRSFANEGYMIINGQKAKILGRICMDQTIVDVTNIDNVNIGDTVIVFGTGENGEQTATDLAKSADTINYEVVCNISKRVPRYYIYNGKVTKVMYKL